MHEKEEIGKNQWEENPPQNIMKKVDKRQSLGSCVIHSNMMLHKFKLLLSECLGEGVLHIILSPSLHSLFLILEDHHSDPCVLSHIIMNVIASLNMSGTKSLWTIPEVDP